MTTKSVKFALAVILPLVIILTSFVAVSALNKQGYIISLYDVDVNILKDGSLDITEKVKFSYLGNSNNAFILINKQEGEEIEIINVYTLKNSEYIKCERLSAGQWDANVFTGTYSQIDESDLVRVKIYGNYENQQATFVVQYKVKNAIKRYSDIAEYKRNHVFKNWDGNIYNININVYLPRFTNHESIKPFLHGVLVGYKSVNDKRRINFSIPNTVPGEYVETRVVFPEYLVSDAPVTEEIDYMETIQEEEKEYLESDKSDLLKARENAAKEVGRIAWNEKMRKRTKLFFAIVSIFASYLGFLTFLRSEKELKSNKVKEVFEFDDIVKISPPEARYLLRWGTGARAFLAGLIHLVYKGKLEIEIIGENKKSYLCFKVSDSVEVEQLDSAEQHLLNYVREMSTETGSFCPEKTFKDSLKLIGYKTWSNAIKSNIAEQNVLTTGQLYYRNLGLIMGMILFAAGCIVPVSLSIWSGYLMLPVGFLLFWYSLNIHKRTEYRKVRVRVIKHLREIICDKNFDINNLPDSISDPTLLLGYGIALSVENKLSLSKALIKCNNESLCSLSEDEYRNRIKVILEKTLIAINDSLFSNVDT